MYLSHIHPDTTEETPTSWEARHYVNFSSDYRTIEIRTDGDIVEFPLMVRRIVHRFVERWSCSCKLSRRCQIGEQGDAGI